VADRIGDVETLSLLHALSRADAAATGPAAWSAWKERLVADLVERVRASLVRGSVSPASTAPAWPPSHWPASHGPAAPAAAFAGPGGSGAPAAHGVPGARESEPEPAAAVEITPDRVVVASANRRGLLARVAGCLTLHRLDVVSADIRTHTTDAGIVTGPMAVVTCRVQPRESGGADHHRLAADLARAAVGTPDVDVDLDEALAARVRGANRSRGHGDHGGSGAPGAGAVGSGVPGDGAAPPRVVWAVDGATDATILELRAADDVGLLFRVARALDVAGVEVRAARISTLGADVVDAFYLTGDWSDADARSNVERTMLAAAGRAHGPGMVADLRRPPPSAC
jgi:[protein-PII] uridylyltransferase